MPTGVRYDQGEVTLTNSFTGNMRGLVNNNGTNMVVPDHKVGGLNVSGLECYQGMSTARNRAAERRTDAQVIQVRFDRPVRDLQFMITDIDASSGQYADRVELTGSYQVTSKASAVSGSGTQASPWQRSSNGNVDHVTGREGNVSVRFAGPVEEFSIRFWNADGGGLFRSLSGNGAQAIFISGMTFRASSCV